jgi:hypothetical protein
MDVQSEQFIMESSKVLSLSRRANVSNGGINHFLSTP